MSVEVTILRQLVHDDVFARKTIPYIKKEYFESKSDQVIFDIIYNHFTKFNERPTMDVLKVELEAQNGLNENDFKVAADVCARIAEPDKQNIDWLVSTAEGWCKERALYLGLLSSLEIIQDKEGKKPKGQIVRILEDALAVSFDTHVGHDFTEDFEERWEAYHKKETRLPFDLEILNQITQGGLPPKSLCVFMGGVGAGKSATMCHMSAAHLTMGKNVLYISMELSEEMVGERIDANLLDVNIQDLKMLPRDTYIKKIEEFKKKIVGRLIIKEYPTAGAGVGHFRHLLHELKLKKKFKPDIIYVDYLNICASSRIKMTGGVGLYQYVKSVTEELRGLAVEYNIPVVTATQLNREGFTSSDPGMEHSSESWGVPATADLVLVMIADKELQQQNKLMFKQIKNRYGDLSVNERFMVGRNLGKMRLYDTLNPTVNVASVVNTTEEKFKKKLDPSMFTDWKA